MRWRLKVFDYFQKRYISYAWLGSDYASLLVNLKKPLPLKYTQKHYTHSTQLPCLVDNYGKNVIVVVSLSFKQLINFQKVFQKLVLCESSHIQIFLKMIICKTMLKTQNLVFLKNACQQNNKKNFESSNFLSCIEMKV